MICRDIFIHSEWLLLFKMSCFLLKDFNKKSWELFPSECECFPKEMFINWHCVSPIGSPSQYPRRGGCSHLEVELSASSVLGQPHQKPRLRLRHWQVQHRRLLFVSHRSDVHGRLQHLWARPGQGQPKLKTTLCQGHSSLQRLGRPVRLLKLNASAMTFCRPFCIGDLLASKKGCQPIGGQN